MIKNGGQVRHTTPTMDPHASRPAIFLHRAICADRPAIRQAKIHRAPADVCAAIGREIFQISVKDYKKRQGECCQCHVL